MKLADKISWLIGRVQRSLFPHLNQCLSTPLTEQEGRAAGIHPGACSGRKQYVPKKFFKRTGQIYIEFKRNNH